METTVLKKRIFLSFPHMSGNEMKYIEEAFQTNWITSMGANVDAFEAEIANLVGLKEAVAVSSGTAAIHLALELLNVSKGDKVFCSSLTFVASANPILYQGAEPVFIDSEPETWNMSPLALERAFCDAIQLGELPKAVIIVNLYGQPAKMDELIAICNHYQVPIIEDAAESLGASYKGKASGTFGELGIYSFNGNKIITSSGGGMLVSNNKELLKKARFLATQAKDDAPHYQHSVVGYNYRMSNILAGIGRGQLEYLTHRVETRRFIFKRYFDELSHLPGLSFMPELTNTRSNRWLTSFTLNENVTNTSVNHLISSLADENIESRPVWKPLHSQPLFQNSRYYPHKLEESVSDQLFKSGICLPSGSNMTDEEQTRVIDVIQNLFQ
ncbi:aminotransferase class I/II-fold pyridoxal phosphate-dependent enzyme [Peribacillus psychrosaccharolyticus]|uniref:Aminotransferase class I/II-fold pyridoxal phosphate-dependent enzyme n=1 Tax=Peribacillus psychrosaccharolyticus TaxID=1407 RepID=A0A974NNC9_PERPY|nr:aminotransferase class I/II-fold pyridoxal phosphate-dependent enzyme [Peribacillus psychrosaccharolyticus]MEC2056059.1 aminotransferase class I/II-fold pyridoxal phosphate-dependent enzyme [Peribacillus psychrosaccharolyticus]MED3745500.1 aminotransferase class I/II-fold pyridoxal phosphate-dependent enzyme [Peribacillus psychrosaccharolyticus]QQT00743.1 aminotransferase class I/II-fold pyridoxal phosphate-dependent enzyme [Peribacillus psychrosaccharolyticus]